MEQVDRDTIQRNIVMLSTMVDLEALYRELIHRGVIDQLFLDRIKTTYRVPQEQAQEFFMSYTKRGPSAFQVLVESLERSGHISEARTLSSNNVNSYNANVFISHPVVSSTTGEVSSTVNRSENGTNGYFPQGSSSSSNSPTSSTSIPNSPLMRHHMSRVEPLSGSNSPTSSCSSSSTDQLRSSLNTCTISEQPPLVIRVRHAEQYNVGIHHAYSMMSRPRGFALIVNNIEFLGDPQSRRDGAEKDSVHLQQLLEQLGFQVLVRHNVRKQELIHHETGIIKRFLDQFRSVNVDAAIVAIMSHGKEGHIRSVDPESSRNSSQNYWHFYDEILKHFNNRYCPALKGKPKIFIVQACQGERRDRGVRRTQIDGRDLSTEESTVSSSFGEWVPTMPPDNIPETEDMIVCYSTVPGFVSNRDIEHGTWYIRTLCKIFMECAWNTDVIKLLQRVGWEMRGISSEFGTKQMSSFHVLGLHHDLYFNPGLFENTLNGRRRSSADGERFPIANNTAVP
ncbi:unnamed protein product [Orchesella dallaii]|uniref:Caspase Dronc n=1 Tax=Orchesella dallaii TaxID=48710 RepID=A0ABP1Q9G4_9HEXA